MLDVFNSNAFTMTSLAATLQKLPYKPSRLGPGGLNLFDERPINTTSIAIESRDGQLSLINATARGSAGDLVGDSKRALVSFAANHLRRNAKVMADEVQGVRLFGTEDQTLTIDAKIAEKLAIIKAMHEVTWEFHRMGAITGTVLDADGSTVLLNLFTEFGVAQNTYDFVLSNANLDVRLGCELVADKIDDELGASSYDEIRVLCGGGFYDAMIGHAYVQAALTAQNGERKLDDLRQGFKIGPLVFERAKRWVVKNSAGTNVSLIGDNVAYAVPVGVVTPDGNPFIGRFAPQPFLDTVNRLNPPLVVKAVADPADQYIELLGISCPLYINTRPRMVVKLTKS